MSQAEQTTSVETSPETRDTPEQKRARVQARNMLQLAQALMAYEGGDNQRLGSRVTMWQHGSDNYALEILEGGPDVWLSAWNEETSSAYLLTPDSVELSIIHADEMQTAVLRNALKARAGAALHQVAQTRLGDQESYSFSVEDQLPVTLFKLPSLRANNPDLPGFLFNTGRISYTLETGQLRELDFGRARPKDFPLGSSTDSQLAALLTALLESPQTETIVHFPDLGEIKTVSAPNIRRANEQTETRSNLIGSGEAANIEQHLGYLEAEFSKTSHISEFTDGSKVMRAQATLTIDSLNLNRVNCIVGVIYEDDGHLYIELVSNDQYKQVHFGISVYTKTMRGQFSNIVPTAFGWLRSWGEADGQKKGTEAANLVDEVLQELLLANDHEQVPYWSPSLQRKFQHADLQGIGSKVLKPNA